MNYNFIISAQFVDFATGKVLDVNDEFTRFEFSYNEPDECFAINIPKQYLGNRDFKKGDGVIYKVIMENGIEMVLIQKEGIEGIINKEDLAKILSELKLAS